MKKKLSEWEREAGVLFPDLNPNQQYTEQEFRELLKDINSFVGVNYTDREEWLEANGYDKTRKNLADSKLKNKGKAK